MKAIGSGDALRYRAEKGHYATIAMQVGRMDTSLELRYQDPLLILPVYKLTITDDLSRTGGTKAKIFAITETTPTTSSLKNWLWFSILYVSAQFSAVVHQTPELKR